MSGISDDVRRVYATALAHNLQFAPTTLYEPCFNTLCEMASVAAQPYNPSNFRFQGDTVDRYRNSVVGNFCESLVVFTLMEYGVDPATIDICRDYQTQVDDKIDIVANGDTYQVKKAKIGTFGQLFVSRKDLGGRADHLASVDVSARKIYIISRSEFLAYVKAEEWSIDGTWKHEYDKTTDAGWYRDVGYFEKTGLLVCLDIPQRLSMLDTKDTDDETA